MKILHVLAQLPIKTGSGVYFTNVIEGLKQFEVGNQQIDWLFRYNINQFIRYRNYFYDFLTVNFCFDFFVS